MKKRIVSLFLAIAFIFSLGTVGVSAADTVDTRVVSVEYMEDGSYFVTSITTVSSARSLTETHTKEYTYCEPSGEKAWTIYVTGTFEYAYGSYSICKSYSHGRTIYDDKWSVASQTSYKTETSEASSATTKATMKKKVLGITTKTVEKSVTITCSKYGGIS